MGKLKLKTTVSPFHLEGRFIGFVGDVEEKPKRLRVATPEGEKYIKLAKDLRKTIREVLQPGDWVRISGKQKYKPKSGKLKLKAKQVQPTAPHRQPNVFQPPAVTPESTPPKATTPKDKKTKDCILVCQKSSCRKRGAGEVCQAVAQSLSDRGLDDRVAIKGTGCMKECKKGPNVIFMPDKSHYTKVDPQDIPELVEKHFAEKLQSDARVPDLSSSQ